ncbi:hypothetical protein [Streptomyces flaveolus]|uniref:hypothetical protein n=1 Tax=Streptomyces flaveolus TaxID=67297 RepID=UPI0036F8F0C6
MGAHGAVSHLKETHDPFKTLPALQPTTETLTPKSDTASAAVREQAPGTTPYVSAAERVSRIMLGEAGPRESTPVPVAVSAPLRVAAPWSAPAEPVHVRMAYTSDAMESGLRRVLSDDSLHRSPLRHRVLEALSAWTGTGGSDWLASGPPDVPVRTVSGPAGPEPLGSADGPARADGNEETVVVPARAAPADSASPRPSRTDVPDGGASGRREGEPEPVPVVLPRPADDGTPGTAAVSVREGTGPEPSTSDRFAQPSGRPVPEPFSQEPRDPAAYPLHAAGPMPDPNPLSTPYPASLPVQGERTAPAVPSATSLPSAGAAPQRDRSPGAHGPETADADSASPPAPPAPATPLSSAEPQSPAAPPLPAAPLSSAVPQSSAVPPSPSALPSPTAPLSSAMPSSSPAPSSPAKPPLTTSAPPALHDGLTAAARPQGPGHVPPARPGATVLHTIPEDDAESTGARPVLPVGHRVSAEQHLALHRPPRIDPTATPAPRPGTDTIRFTDGSRLPVYMSGVAGLLPGLPGDVVQRSFTMGQSDQVLRGADQVAREIIGRLEGEHRPQPPHRRASDGADEPDLLHELRRSLERAPHRFFGDGERVVYRTADGRTAVLTVVARPYGHWSRYGAGYADPVKTDTMQRSTVTTGRTAVNSTSASLVPSVPLGPAKQMANGWGKVFFRTSWGKRAQYSLQNHTVNQTETRATDGSHVHLDDVWYEVAVTGRPRSTGSFRQLRSRTDAAESPATAFGFAVRDGLRVRLAKSLTEDRPAGGDLPERVDLGGRPAYRLQNTEAWGPMAHIRDWALEQAKVSPESSAGRVLADFFSTDGFHRMSRTLNTGQITTPPLFRDEAGRAPLGVFTVEVRSGDAVLISATTAAELRDITQSTLRNERVVGSSRAVEIGAAAGPSFQLFGLEHGKFDLRLLAGINARYGSARGRTAATGGTGAIKFAGQAKGVTTGLYLVQKTITITAPPDTKAPLPSPRAEENRPGKLRKNPPQRWSAAPRKETFQTWAVERMPQSEIRRLAGLDRDPPLGPEPAVPPYLAADDPASLGMARPEAFTFADGSFTRTVDGRERTFPEHLADRVLEEIGRAYPGMVAPLHELNPDNPRWRDPDHFQMALANTLEVLNTLTHHGLAGHLPAMMTTGLRIPLVDSRSATRAMRYVWIDARLTGRRFEGRQEGLRLRFSAPGSETLSGRQSASRGLYGGVEGLLSLRDTSTDGIGGPLRAGTASVGGHYGVRSESESEYGPGVQHEALAISGSGAHLYSYELTLTARRGGFWRFRSLLRGPLLLNLLGTQPFVFRERETALFSPVHDPATGRAPDGTPAPAGRDATPVGRVLISIPQEHTPVRTVSREPHPVHGVPLPVPERVARDLALATPALLDQAARRHRPAHHNHPVLTLAVVPHSGLTEAVAQVVREASAGSWLMTQYGAPAHDAATNVFQSPYLTANFDQTSSPTGWRASGLWAKAAYLNRSSVIAHRTRILPHSLTAVTAPVAVDTENTLSGMMQAAGRAGRTSTVFLGGQLVFLDSHGNGHGPTGRYGLVLSPYTRNASQFLVVSRTAAAEVTRSDSNRQVLVTGDVLHEVAAASTTVGRRAGGWRHTPRSLASAAGRRVLVPGGWVGHIPEKSAYRLGLLTDRWGDVPRYTRRTWSPLPWLSEHPFGGFPVNSLDSAAVLRDFGRRLRPLGLTERDRDSVHRLVSDRALRALGRELIGPGASVPARIGRWGSQSLQVWIGERQVRVRAELVPVRLSPGTESTEDGRAGFGGMDHSVELDEQRHAVETVQEGGSHSSGFSVGTVLAEGLHTTDPVVKSAGPVWSEVGTSRRHTARRRTEGSVRIASVTTTQAHGEYVTRYRLRLTLEITDSGGTGDPRPGDAEADTTVTAAPGGHAERSAHRTDEWWRQWTGRRHHTISVEGDVGLLVEHYPLSLMRPDPPAEPGPRTLAPPVPHEPGTPRQVAVPRTMGAGGWHDVRHPADGGLRPFELPEDGFKVRRIVGLEQLHTANVMALASAYDPTLTAATEADGTLLAQALDTPLTRAGTGAAQSLEDGSGNGALTAFYDRTLTADGYALPGLADRGFLHGADADLRMYSRPDFAGARLLAVADGVKHEAPRRDLRGAGTSVTREGTTESAIGGGPVVSSQSMGASQMGVSGPGDHTTDSEALVSSDDRLRSVNVKTQQTRTFLFAIPTTWLSVAAVSHQVWDTAVAQALRGTFGGPAHGPRAVQTDTSVIAWVREDVAYGLGLIDDVRFPARSAAAWDAVTRADKEWTAADKKYWELRRGEGAARERELADAEAAVAALVAGPARERSPGPGNAEGSSRSGTAESRTSDGNGPLDARTGEARTSALAEARAALGAARRRSDEFAAVLRTARAAAEALAEEYARVREAADLLTHWHFLNGTPEGRRLLASVPEPPGVVFTPPPPPDR